MTNEDIEIECSALATMAQEAARAEPRDRLLILAQVLTDGFELLRELYTNRQKRPREEA